MSFSLTENGTAFTADAARDGENVTVTVTSPAEIAGTSLTFGKDGREAGFGGVTVPLPEGCADVLYLITRVMSPSVELRTVSGGGEAVTYETGGGTLEVKYNRDGIPLTVTVGDVTADVTAAK